MTHRLLVISLGILALALACNRFSPSSPGVFIPADPTIGDEGVGVSSQVLIDEPRFAGLGGMVAGDGVIHLQWDSADDDNDPTEALIYRVYLATGPGDQDFVNPTLETGLAALSASISEWSPGVPLTNGVEIYAVVRSVDTEGNEDTNRHEWIATPNPVRLVVAGNPFVGADGLTPATAYGKVSWASVDPLWGVGLNLFVAAGSYDNNPSIAAGVSVYGGFDASFDVASRDPSVHFTELFSGPASIPGTAPVDLVTLERGSALTAIDGFILSGNNAAEVGIRADGGLIRISKCEIRDNKIHGIELFSLVSAQDSIDGFIRGCVVSGSGGEGIVIDAITNLVIDNNRIRDVANEGIESQWIYGAASTNCRLEVTRNILERCGDDGIDLDFAEVSEIDPSQSQGARVRLVIRGNLIRDCRLMGCQVDLDFENSDGIDFRARIEDNKISANGTFGISLDGDAASSFRLARNVITANRGPGVRLSGTAFGPAVWIGNCRILGNSGPGILLMDHSTVELRQCLLAQNGGAGLVAPQAWVDACGNVFSNNGANSPRIPGLRYSAFHGEDPPAVGEALLLADPRLERTPLAVLFATGTNVGDRILLPGSSELVVGRYVEIGDDGIARKIIALVADGVRVDPAPSVGVLPQQAVFIYATDDVLEREGLLLDSLAIDAGDPLEFDRDDTRADLGPNGGVTPGNVGVETAIAMEKAPIELKAYDPPLSRLLTATSLNLRFTGQIPITVPVRAFSDGLSVHANAVESGADLSLSPDASTLPGTIWRLELEPFLDQPRRIVHELVFAALEIDGDPAGSDSNGSIALAPDLGAAPVVVTGAVGFAGDVDVYRIHIASGETLTVELFAGREETGLQSQLSLLDGSGTVLGQSATTIPTQIDPAPLTLAGTGVDVFVQVQGTATIGTGAIGNYTLELRVN